MFFVRGDAKIARTISDGEIEAAIALRAMKMREASPDTSVQWLRLQRALAQDAAPVRPARRRSLVRFAYAGAFVIAIAASVALLFRHTSSPERFVTGLGEHSTVILPDSSEVTLNYSSSIDFDR